MFNVIAVFIGGGIGSVFRYVVCAIVASHWATICVNLIGAFLIGMAYEYFSTSADLSTRLKLFIMSGLLGGFTTFSTYLLDFITLFQEGQKIEAISYLLTSIILGLVMLLVGIQIMRDI